MTRKLILILTFITTVLVYADAQEQRFKAGLILGSTFSQLHGDNSSGYLRVGLTGGLRAVTIITEKIEISFELLFEQRGSRSQPAFDEEFFPFKITTNHVSVPVLFNFQDWLDSSEEYYKLHFHAGLAYGRLIEAKVNDEDIVGSIFIPNVPFFKKNDLSLIFGATYYINKNIGITGRFNRSVTRLYKSGDGTLNRSLVGKHLTLQFLYMF